MRILFFTPYQLWPSNSGARLRALHLAAALSRQSAVTLFQILQPHEPESSPIAANQHPYIISTRKEPSYTTKKVLGGLIGPVPLTVLNYQSTNISRALRSILSDQAYDSVQLESIHLFPYVDVINSQARRPAILLDWHNIESELMFRYAKEAPNLPKRLVARRTAYLLEQLENKALQTCDAHAVVSEREREKLSRRYPGAAIHVMPNGVDTAAFSWAANGSRPKTLLFVGSMDYHANIDAVLWFTGTVWPLLTTRLPDLQFYIVGRSPSREVQALAGRNVHVTGTVEDVRPFYAEALALIVPLRVGGGTRLKILEAMAMGVPVISTSLGAEGIEAIHNIEIVIADNGQGMVSAVEQLYSDSKWRTSLALSGRRLVEARYDWNSIGDRLHDVHASLAQKRTSI